VWTFVWYSFGEAGVDPIRFRNPISVTKESAKVDWGDYGQSYQIVYMALFSMVVVHQTVCIQLAHVTKQAYNPWTKLYLFVVSSILFMIVISMLRR
jgi:hypothetical protein